MSHIAANWSILKSPSPILCRSLTPFSCFADIIAQSKSGTGKTLAFSIPALELLKSSSLAPQVLILSPTRELATQTHSVLSELGRHKKGLHCHCFIGGLSYNADIAKLSPCNVIVGTPGRILQLINDGFFLTSSLRMFILDEADKMLQEGALKSTTMEIMRSLPATIQHICVSATYTPAMLRSLESIILQPEKVMLAAGNPTLEGVKQYYRLAGEEDSASLAKLHTWKTNQLIGVLSSLSFHQCIVFSNVTTRSTSLVEKLNAQGWPTTAISSSLTQVERNKAMDDLRDFKTRILVSSDLVARGLDIDRINLVINLDMPFDAETYLHRVGRTGRFGTLGVAISLLGRSELPTLTAYLKSYDSNLSELPDQVPADLYDFELSEKDKQAKATLEESGRASADATGKSTGKGKRKLEARDMNDGSRTQKRKSDSVPLAHNAPRRSKKTKNLTEEYDEDPYEQESSYQASTAPQWGLDAPQPPPDPSSFYGGMDYLHYIETVYMPHIHQYYS